MGIEGISGSNPTYGMDNPIKDIKTEEVSHTEKPITEIEKKLKDLEEKIKACVEALKDSPTIEEQTKLKDLIDLYQKECQKFISQINFPKPHLPDIK